MITTAHDRAAKLQAHRQTLSLTVNDLQRSIAFYTDGFGFEIKDRYETDGQLVFVSVTAGDCEIGLGQDDFAKGRDRMKGVGLRTWIQTKQDLNALAMRAKSAGITLDGDPAPLPWGPMAFSFTDPDGFKYTVSNG